MKQIYIAEYRYDKPSLDIVSVDRETKLMYFVKDVKTLIGWRCTYSDRIHKEKYHCFFNFDDAIQFLIDSANKTIFNYEEKINKNNDIILELEKFKDSYKTENEK